MHQPPQPLGPPPPQEQSPLAGRVRWALAAAKLVVVLLVLWGIRGALRPTWHELTAQGAHWRWEWLALASLAYLVGLLPAARFYQRILLANGQEPLGWSAWRAFFISEVGKYVPGKAMVVVLRAALAAGPRVDPAVAAVGVFYETFSVMAVGCLLGALASTVWLGDQPPLVAAAWCLAVVAWIPLVPPVFRRAAALAGRVSRDPTVLASWRVAPRDLAQGWLLMALGWIAWGASLACTLVALGTPPAMALAALPRTTASVALGVGVGFFSFVPGGAVVREGVMMELLRPVVDEGGALLAPIVLRGVWLLSEVVISVILYGWPWARRPAT